jgi:UDP-N-acetylmuramoylalanine--D-glutamate ligase
VSGPADILVVGAGKSGLAAASLASRLGFRPTLTDDKHAPDSLPAGVRFAAAADIATAGDFAFERVVVSPGVPKTHPLLAGAAGRGIDVVSELAFAAEQIDARITAVTGTNGKSTVVSLVGAICEKAGRRTFIGGNLGNPLSEAAGRPLDECIVEVSSFQMEWPGTFHPVVGAVLNISPDHLDRHGDIDTYIDAKMQLFARMGVNDRAAFGRGQDWWPERINTLPARISTFGLQPVEAGECGTRADRSARTVARTVARAAEPNRDGDEALSISLPADWPRAPHDFENVAAAVEIACLLGLDAASIEAALADFKPLRHRLALVRSVAGVEYWNDSKATNAGATRSTLEAFGKPVILLAGGASKGASFAELGASAGRIAKLVAYGEAAAAIERELGENLPVVRAAGLAEAVTAAAGFAKAGDVVLLAPACASFDEFSSYADRGECFERLVDEMARKGE